MSVRTQKSNIGRRRELAQASNEEDYQQKREQLLQAAGQIFREKGYEGASMADFANAIGIDRASLYYYISGKAELFQEIVLGAVRANAEMIEGIRDSDLPPGDKIRTFVVGLMQSFEDHFPYLYVYLQEDMARLASGRTAWARTMRKLGERFEAAATAILEQARAARAIRTDAPSARLILLAIVGMCNWSHRWFRPDGAYTADEIGAQFADIVLAGILA